MQIDSVMTRFARQGTPVLNLVEIRELARAYGFPMAPTRMPAVGAGTVYGQRRYHRPLAAAVLVAILLAVRATVLTGLAPAVARFLQLGGATRGRPGETASDSPLELMV
jgi:hypothetical protein